MFTTVLNRFFCQRFCLAHESTQSRNRCFNTDALESRYLLPIEELARHDTFCPDCRAQYHLVPIYDRRSE